MQTSANAGERVSTQSNLTEESSSTDNLAEDVAIDTSVANPFKNPVAAVDPISKAKVGAVLLGPVFKAKRGADFDFYRYVTFYNIESRKDRIYSLPVHREQCFDKSEFFWKLHLYLHIYRSRGC